MSTVEAFVGAVNGYVTGQEPWQVARDSSPEARDRLATILRTAAECLRAIAVLHHPVMPNATARLWEQLGAEAALGPVAEQRINAAARWGQLPPGISVTKGDALFPRLEEPAGHR